MPYNFISDIFTQVLPMRRYERKYIENRRCRTNAVTLIQKLQGVAPPTNHFCTVS